MKLSSLSTGCKTSLVIHIAILLALFVSLPHLRDPKINQTVVAVEILPVSQKTNMQQKTLAATTPASEAPKPAEPVKQEVTKETKTETATESKKVPMKEAAKPTTSKEIKKTPNKKQAQVINKVTKATPQKGQMSDSFDKNLPLTISEKDNIKFQIERKFINPVVFDFKPNQVVVKIKLEMLESGHIKNVTVLPDSVYSNDTKDIFHSLQENLISAVYRASPLQNLPQDKYSASDGWKDIVLVFDAFYLMN